MVNKCSVPGCKGNYTNKLKVHTFGFPKNEQLRSKWIHAIQRRDFVPSKYSTVCEQHFRKEEVQKTSIHTSVTGEQCILKYKRFQLFPGAVPSIFPKCPKSSTSAPSSLVPISAGENVETTKRGGKHFQVQAEDNSIVSNVTNESQNKFSTFDDFLANIGNNKPPNSCITVRTTNSVVFIFLATTPPPKVKASAVVDKNLQLSLFVEKEELTQLGQRKFPQQINKFSELNTILLSIDAEAAFWI